MTHDLDQFLAAQAGVYEGVLDELRRGRKTGHWIWFIFPQVAGLGSSAMSQRYAIGSLDEARAYLEHPVLGTRLRECAGIVLETRDRTASDIFGSLDAMKVRSCMTLFHRAAPDEAGVPAGARPLLWRRRLMRRRTRDSRDGWFVVPSADGRSVVLDRGSGRPDHGRHGRDRGGSRRSVRGRRRAGRRGGPAQRAAGRGGREGP